MIPKNGTLKFPLTTMSSPDTTKDSEEAKKNVWNLAVKFDTPITKNRKESNRYRNKKQKFHKKNVALLIYDSNKDYNLKLHNF